jgi:hypothetical protein
MIVPHTLPVGPRESPAKALPEGMMLFYAFQQPEVQAQIQKTQCQLQFEHPDIVQFVVWLHPENASALVPPTLRPDKPKNNATRMAPQHSDHTHEAIWLRC